MLRNSVSYFFYAMHAVSHVVPVHRDTVRKLLPSRTFPGWHSPAPYLPLVCMRLSIFVNLLGRCDGLLALLHSGLLFPPSRVVSKGALLLLIHVASRCYIAFAYPPRCRWGLLACYCLPTACLLLSTACLLLSTACLLLSTACLLLSTTCLLLSIAYRLPSCYY